MVLPMVNKLCKLVNQTVANYHLFRLKRDQWKDPRQLRNIQFKKLKAIVKYAYDHIPYYHRLFSAAKIGPEQIRNFEDMRKIPTVSKQDIQKNFPDMVARGVDVSRLAFARAQVSIECPLIDYMVILAILRLTVYLVRSGYQKMWQSNTGKYMLMRGLE